MKVFFDHQTFIEQNYGGISRYFYELIHAFSLNDEIEFKHSILYSNNEYLKEDSKFNIRSFLSISNWITSRHFIGKSRLFRLAKFFGFASDHLKEMENYVKNSFATEKIDIFHPTYYNTYYKNFLNLKEVPIVLTVYDMIHELFPDFFYGVETQNQKRWSIDAATKIIAISESTKRDIQRYYKIPEDKIHVIYLASSLERNCSNLVINKDLSNSILYVGNRSVYKNFHFFLESIIGLFQKYPEMNLILAGGEQICKRDREILKKLKLQERIHRIAIKNNDTLGSLYKSSRLFVFPSLYEGFGIPLLEAMQFGCPVVCSNTSSFPEVAGDAALYFDPTNKESIFKAVESVYSNESLRKDLIEKGYEQSANFSWEKTASETFRLYKSLI